MDEEVERLLVSVRADTGAFRRDVAEMRRELDGPLKAGVEKAGRLLENTLVRAVRTGKLGLEDLKRVALSVMAEIAEAAIRAGIASIGKSGGKAEGKGAPGGLLAAGVGVLGAALGLPGRATGGPVAPGRAYVVGERGPELFVPTASGRVDTPPPRGGREVRLSITVNAPGAEPQALARSSRQVARAVRAELARAED